MSPTTELRFLRKEFSAPYENAGVFFVDTLQQKWVAHHIPAGKTEAEFEWRDVETVKETK